MQVKVKELRAAQKHRQPAKHHSARCTLPHAPRTRLPAPSPASHRPPRAGPPPPERRPFSLVEATPPRGVPIAMLATASSCNPVASFHPCWCCSSCLSSSGGAAKGPLVVVCRCCSCRWQLTKAMTSSDVWRPCSTAAAVWQHERPRGSTNDATTSTSTTMMKY